MKLSRKINKFQEGGEMESPEVAPEGAEPMPEQGGDPLEQIAQMAMQALQTQDCNLAMQVCDAFIQIIQQAQGGAPQAQGEPVFRKGGKLAYRLK